MGENSPVIFMVREREDAMSHLVRASGLRTLVSSPPGTSTMITNRLSRNAVGLFLRKLPMTRVKPDHISIMPE